MVSVSVGIAVPQPEGTSIDHLLQQADRALYEAKAAGQDIGESLKASASEAATQVKDSASESGVRRAERATMSPIVEAVIAPV